MMTERVRCMSDARTILDHFYSLRLGVCLADLKPGQVAVATCDRRTYAELGYGFVRLLWVFHFGDRAAVSVHPAALAEVSRLAWRRTPDELIADDFVAAAARALAFLPGVSGDAGGGSVILYHPGDAQPMACDADVRALTSSDKDGWAGQRAFMNAANHPCVARGEAFGVFLADKLVADVMTHESSVAEMAHLVAEDGIEVAEACRRRGYGKAVLAAWTREMQARGRACVHSTSSDNTASVALAKAVGYLEYARTRVLSWSEPD